MSNAVSGSNDHPIMMETAVTNPTGDVVVEESQATSPSAAATTTATAPTTATATASSPPPADPPVVEETDAQRRKRERKEQKRLNQKKADWKNRDAIAKAYQLWTGAKILEQQAFTNAEVSNHAVAKEHLLNTIETMKDEADEIWNSLEAEQLGKWEQQFLRFCQCVVHGGGGVRLPKDHPEYGGFRHFTNVERKRKRMYDQGEAKEQDEEVNRHKVQVVESVG